MTGDARRESERPPSIFEDLGTVGAVSLRRDPVPWLLGAALLVSTAWWAPWPVAVGWCLVAALLAVPVPLVPRFMTRGAPAVVWIVVAGALLGARPDDDPSREKAPLAVMLGLGQAMALPWAAALTRARRSDPTVFDGDAASARLAIRLQEHPWRAGLLVLPLVGPCGALWLSAWIATDHAHSGNIPALVMVPHWMTPGALLLVAATFGGRRVRATELGVVALAVAGAVWGALAWLADLDGGFFSFLWEILRFLLHLGGASLLLLVAATWTGRIPLDWKLRPLHAKLALAVWLVAEAAIAALVAVPAGGNPPPESLDEWGVVLLRHGLLLGLLAAAAASSLRGRTLVALCVVYGAVVSMAVAWASGRSEWALPCAAVAALGCLNQAFFTLAVRRVRSLTVVPRDHVLRADWAVDRRAGAPPAG